MRYLCLPRFTPCRLFSDPDPQTGRIRQFAYLREPYYVAATWWNRWGPEALLTRLLGGTVPGGKEGDRYMPQGFLVPEVGPAYHRNKLLDEMKAFEDKMTAPGAKRGGCPFGF